MPILGAAMAHIYTLPEPTCSLSCFQLYRDKIYRASLFGVLRERCTKVYMVGCVGNMCNIENFVAAHHGISNLLTEDRYKVLNS